MQHGFDTDTAFAKNTGDIRQHTGLVFGQQAQIIGGFNIVHAQYRLIGQRIRLECQVRYAVFGISRQCPGYIHNIRHHRRSRRFGTCTRSVVQRWPHGIRFNQNGIHDAVYIGDQPTFGYQGRMHTQFDPVISAPGYAQVFDTVAKLVGIVHIIAGNLADAFGIDLVKLQGNTKCNRRQDRQLVRRVDTFHIKGRIGFSVSQLLRFCQDCVEVAPLVAHFGKNEITGAINYSGQPFDLVARQPFPHRLDNRDTTGHRCFKGNHHLVVAGGLKNLVTVQGDQGLVGCYHMFTIIERLDNQFAGRFITANQFNNNIDIRVLDQRKGIITDIDRINAG